MTSEEVLGCDVWDASSLSLHHPFPIVWDVYHPCKTGQTRALAIATSNKAGSCTVHFGENFRTSLTRARQLLRERQAEKQLQERLNRQQSRVSVLTLTVTASRLTNLELHLCIIGGSCHKYFILFYFLFFFPSFLSRQTYVFVRTKHAFRRDKRFVSRSILLSRQKTCFVATKMILVAASASETRGAAGGSRRGRR